LTNDLIWWIPFTLYLAHAWPFFYDDIRRDITGSHDYATPNVG
jgi:hypothetical protein